MLNVIELKESFPVNNTYPSVCFKYGKTLGQVAFNYKSTLENIDKIPETCKCEDSPYKDVFWKHIITGDLNILKDPKLIDIFSKGSKFRMCNYVSKKDLYISFNDDLREYCNRLSYSHSLAAASFSEWKCKLLAGFKEALHERDMQLYKSMYNKDIIKQIKKNQEELVICPVDKASNNFGFV